MLTLGDVLAMVALTVAFGLASWSVMILSALLFPGRTKKAATAVAERPIKVGLVGFAVGLVGIVMGLVLLSHPEPLLKLVGFVMLLAIFTLATLGSGALARALAKRVGDAGGAPESFFGLTRGAGLLVLSGLLPLVGLFVILPIALSMAIGGGLRAISRREAPPVVEVEAA